MYEWEREREWERRKEREREFVFPHKFFMPPHSQQTRWRIFKIVYTYDTTNWTPDWPTVYSLTHFMCKSSMESIENMPELLWSFVNFPGFFFSPKYLFFPPKDEMYDWFVRWYMYSLRLFEFGFFFCLNDGERKMIAVEI